MVPIPVCAPNAVDSEPHAPEMASHTSIVETKPIPIPPYS